ncbi:hypothetical protein AJ78_03681 [Emergomyces pasteurianus Ep9510]|uniref:Uncharacterized protein n=1 Tax=Emergomyces pasteurianus Ep9510 TaxID=1447872 RepID=A0A1J9QLM6_9EURO|nr:hypothetical protein AJ78_03681 [Emergomyces pasteurianus Ep9510]
MPATIEELRKKNVPKKAEKKWTVPDTEYRWKNPVNANKERNAHEVIKTVVDNLLAKIEKIVSPVRQLPVRFYEAQPQQPGGKVLASRKRKDARRGGISKKPTKGGRKCRQSEPPVPVDSRADDIEINDDAAYPQSASLDILANVANNVSYTKEPSSNELCALANPSSFPAISELRRAVNGNMERQSNNNAASGIENMNSLTSTPWTAHTLSRGRMDVYNNAFNPFAPLHSLAVQPSGGQTDNVGAVPGNQRVSQNIGEINMQPADNFNPFNQVPISLNNVNHATDFDPFNRMQNYAGWWLGME